MGSRTKPMAGTAAGIRVAAQMIVDKKGVDAQTGLLARLVVDWANQVEELTPKPVKRPAAKAPRKLDIAPTAPKKEVPFPERQDGGLGIRSVCQKCLQKKKSTRSREMRLANYVGRCGDSFCAGSCDSSSCFPVHATVCDECEKELTKKK